MGHHSQSGIVQGSRQSPWEKRGSGRGWRRLFEVEERAEECFLHDVFSVRRADRARQAKTDDRNQWKSISEPKAAYSSETRSTCAIVVVVSHLLRAVSQIDPSKRLPPPEPRRFSINGLPSNDGYAKPDALARGAPAGYSGQHLAADRLDVQFERVESQRVPPPAKKGRAAAARAGRDARAESLRAMPPVDECLRAGEGVDGIDGLGREYAS